MMVGTIGPMESLPLSLASLFSLSSLEVVDTRTLLLTTSVDTNSSGGSNGLVSLFRLGLASILGYSTLINGAIAILFKTRRGMSLVGKNRTDGTIPLWSYVILFPFHIPTVAYTYIHTKYGTMNKPYSSSNSNTINEDTPQAANKTNTMTTTTTTTTKVEKITVPVASEVQPGWWVGGCYSNRLNMHWAGVVDCTVEFPEQCKTEQYLCLPTWDGVPATPEQLDTAAKFCMDAIEEWNRLRKTGLVEGEPNILIHCAHGRGRSTTVMCAALVKMGYFSSYEEALVKGIQPSRPCCKLNKMMKTNLAEWQRIYIDGKKDS
jgi:protein-tyrosine phosphatase